LCSLQDAGRDRCQLDQDDLSFSEQRLSEHTLFVPDRRVADDERPSCFLDDAPFEIVVSIRGVE
jgi:hypothetical protein